jgi:hypothetical protein
MRGLLKAALLASAVVSTYAVHHVEAIEDFDDIEVTDVVQITGSYNLLRIPSYIYLTPSISRPPFCHHRLRNSK